MFNDELFVLYICLITKTYVKYIAFKRKDYKRIAAVELQKILVDWCVMRYAQIMEIDNEWQIHCAKECFTHMYTLAACNTRNGEGRTRFKVLAKVLKKIEFDENAVILKLLHEPFFDFEDYHLYKKYIPEIVQDCIKECHFIAKLITRQDIDEIYAYMKSLQPLL